MSLSAPASGSTSAAVSPFAERPSGNLQKRGPERGVSSRTATSSEGDEILTMFRSSKTGKQVQLSPRLSDPFETEPSTGAVEWEKEPILNLVTAVLGAGVLGFPFCFKTCGLGLAVLLVAVTLAAAELSMRLLLMASQLTGKRSYEDLARHSFGRPGQWAVGSCVLAMNVGSVVAYLNILTDTISSVAGTVIPPGAEPSRNIMLGVVTMGGCLPVALFVRSAQLLSAVNSVSMVFLLFFCCIIALLPFSPTPNTGDLLWWRWEGVLVAFPIVSYGFTAHHYLFQIYPASQKPSLRKMTTAVQRGMLLSAAIYVAVGACGYGAFGERTAGDVLRNFGGQGASGVRLQAERVLKYGFGVSLLGVIPLTVIPLHSTLAPWLTLCSPAYGAAARQAAAAGLGYAGVPLSQLQESLLTAAILAASFALAVLLPNVEFVFGLAGSTASTLMAFILPAAIFLSVTSTQRGMLGHSMDMLRGTGPWRQRRRMAGALLLFGCLAGVLCTQALVVSIQEEKEVVQLAQELVREETKVAVAAQTEAKAKQVAAAVETVVKAAQEVETAKAEASGQAEKLATVAQALNSSATTGGKKERQQQKAAATSELKRAHSEVDKTVAKLENVTATLGATASRLRDETAASKVAAGGGDAGTEALDAAMRAKQQQEVLAQQAQQATRLAQHHYQQQQAARGSEGTAGADGGADGGSSSRSAGTAAHTGVVRAAEAAVAKLHSAVRADQSPAAEEQGKSGADDVAEALEKVASTANDTLTAVKQSKVALEAAAAEAATVGKSRAKVKDLGKVVSEALNATTEAAARLNATAAALKAVEQEKTSELLTMVKELAAGEEKEAAREEKQRAAEERQAAHEQQQHGLGRKEGFGAGSGKEEAGGKEGTKEGDKAAAGKDGKKDGGKAAAGGEGKAGDAAAGAGDAGDGSKAGAGGGEDAQAGAPIAAAANGSSPTPPPAGKARHEVREALKQAAAEAEAATGSGNLTGAVVNVTHMAQVAIDAATAVVDSSKASVEQAIEKKKPKVTTRAIEIAKELHAGASGGGGNSAARSGSSSSSSSSNGTSSGSTTAGGGSGAAGGVKVVSVIEHAATKHVEIVSRQLGQEEQPDAASPAAAAAADAAPPPEAAAVAGGAANDGGGGPAAAAAEGAEQMRAFDSLRSVLDSPP